MIITVIMTLIINNKNYNNRNDNDNNCGDK